jgi:hypothetical protein
MSNDKLLLCSGGWFLPSTRMTCGSREYLGKGVYYYTLGFRVVLTQSGNALGLTRSRQLPSAETDGL